MQVYFHFFYYRSRRVSSDCAAHCAPLLTHTPPRPRPTRRAQWVHTDLRGSVRPRPASQARATSIRYHTRASREKKPMRPAPRCYLTRTSCNDERAWHDSSCRFRQQIRREAGVSAVGRVRTRQAPAPYCSCARPFWGAAGWWPCACASFEPRSATPTMSRAGCG
jgi:hypothetical protein